MFRLRNLKFFKCIHNSRSIITSNLIDTKCYHWRLLTLRHLKCIHTSSFLCEKRKDDISEIPGVVAEKYDVFRDEDSQIILDVDEERQKHMESQIAIEDTEADEYAGINLERGVFGVFDIEDLVCLLRREKAQDIFVASMPAEYKYVDYIVVVSGNSKRHMDAMAEFVRRTFKRKMHKNDRIPKIEGENSQDWLALDLGNIALHIFSKKARLVYDLECLWSVGAEYDDLCNKPDDPVISLLQQHAIYLGSLESQESKG